VAATSNSVASLDPVAEDRRESGTATLIIGPPRWRLGGLTERAVPISADFQYVHEPLDDDCVIPLLGNAALIRSIKDRIRRSQSGACLVTGFRGVGKTTLVRRAIKELSRELPRDTAMVSVWVTMARPMTTNELLFAIVRRVFEELGDQGLFARLPADVQDALMRSYTRTSFTVKETTRNDTERGVSVSVGGAQPVVGTMPTLSAGDRRTRSRATEASFLTYSESDVEYDVLRIIQLLRDGSRARPRARRWWRRRTATTLRIRLVIVLDEIDKLTTAPDGISIIEKVVTELKNVLTTRGAHFVFVAGADLSDQVVYDSHRGNGVFESVFAWRLYVPCIWSAPDRLLAALLPEHHRPTELAEYLRFKARGLPRRLLQEFNELVRWDSGRPMLAVDPPEAERLAFYAALDRALQAFLPRESDNHTVLFPLPIDDDRWRLGTYFVTDWILRSEGRQFTVMSIRRAAESSELDPVLRIPDVLIERLIDFLAGRGIVTRLHSPGGSSTRFGDVAETQLPIYQLSQNVRQLLAGFVVYSERERGDLDVSPPIPYSAGAPAPMGAHQARPGEGPSPAVGTARVSAGSEILEDRYALLELVGQGALGRVYRARDIVLGRHVAIKMINDHLVADEHVRARFLREVELAAKLNHPGIVTVYGASTDPGHLFLAMEYIDGDRLDTVIPPSGLPPVEAVAIVLDLLDALDYLHRHGLARIDLKPSNIIVSDGRPVIIDLGIARPVEGQTTGLTQTGTIVGTPSYMAPEQAKGERIDIRTDLYAVGLILFECLAGRPARSGDSVMELLLATVTTDVDVSVLPGSLALRAVVSTATARDPEQRYPDPASMRAALAATPETEPP
jgi:tRNA A-37 threonylcarbamoyl transferase component Bud32